MDITLGQIAISYMAVTNYLNKENLPVKVNYWIFKNMKWLEDNYTFFCKEQNKIYKDCLFADDNGMYIKIDNDGTLILDSVGEPLWNYRDNMEEEFIRRKDELSETSVEVDPYLLDLELVGKTNPDWMLKGEYLKPLYFLIK